MKLCASLGLIPALALFCAIGYGQKGTSSENRKDNLLTRVLSGAGDFFHLLPVMDIIKKSKHYDFVPSLFPINPKKYRRISSVYGRRFHPIDKHHKSHWGLDISASRGVPVHVTANGKVAAIGNSKDRYGKQILIDHKFGFQTRYAHLSLIYIKPGKKVKKGDVIGFVGSSGKSTGAHLHYEVIKNGKNIDPINFIE